MKAIEQYVSVVLFIVLYKVVMASESQDKIFKFGHSNEQHFSAVLFSRRHDLRWF